MRTSKEIRQWINNLRSRRGKRNGVVHGYRFDCPEMERKSAKAAKTIKRARLQTWCGEGG